jgi:hypothetical protein
MKLVTAHKILITSAVIFFVFFSGWEYRNFTAGDASAAWRSGLYLIAGTARNYFDGTLSFPRRSVRSRDTQRAAKGARAAPKSMVEA